MIGSVAAWRFMAALLPPGAIPDRPDLGERYPWREVVLHARTGLHQRRVQIARQRLTEAVGQGGWLGWSGGKDSTALAALCADIGLSPPTFSQKDDLDYPGEEDYLRTLAARFRLTLDIIRPPASIFEAFVRQVTDPTEEVHARGTALSDTYFYGLLDRHRRDRGYNHIVLGLRAQESVARNVNRASHGWDYTRVSGLRVSSPLADWSDLDVHAYLAARNVPLLPVYLCIDPGADPLRIRKSWWVVGGPAALRGHYRWLRRWWPALYQRLASRMPGVIEIS